MSDDRVPNHVPLDTQQEAPDRDLRQPGELGDLDVQGEGLDERGLSPSPSPANPISDTASMTGDD